jgi:RNA polymerase sigma factor (sigma-70 family)
MASFEFEELVNRYTDLITRVIRRTWTSNLRVTTVQDIRQEVLMKLLKRYDAGYLDPNEQFSNRVETLAPIIKKTARNTTIRYLRDMDRGNAGIMSGYIDVYKLLPAPMAPENMPDERTEQLNKMLESYSHEVIRIIALRRDGASFRKISRVTGLTEENVRKIMERTISKLRETAQADQEQ